ncbi:MAG: hypothetical protein WB473_17205 [Pedococcus sp.]
MRTSTWTAHEHTVRRWDAAVAAWVLFWLLAGVAAGYEIWQLTALSQSTVESGQGLQRAGDALRRLGGTPVIGEKTGEIGDQISQTAASIIDGGQRASSSIKGMSLIIGLAVALIPAGSVLGGYLPGRRARRRDVKAVRTALGRAGMTKALEGYLAQRAVSVLPVTTLLEVSEDPYRDLSTGHHRALASAELRRLGIVVSGVS